MTADAADYGTAYCPRCKAYPPRVTVTGRHERRLFLWQQGTTHGRPNFTLERDGHNEAEVKCSHCNNLFWTISPVAIAEALVMDADGKLDKLLPEGGNGGA